MRVALPILVIALAGACTSASSAPEATDAGADAPAIAVDGGDARASSDGGACDPGPVPPLRDVTSTVTLEGDASDAGDAGVVAAPVATGGDPSGTWIYTHLTLYLPPQAKGQIDPAKSKLEGRGFIAIDQDRFRQLTETTTTLSTSAVGMVVRTNNTRAIGRFAADGGALRTETECSEGGVEGSLGELGFSRLSPTQGRLHLLLKGQLGESKLTIDLERAP